MSISLIGSNNIDKNKRKEGPQFYHDDYAMTESGGSVQFTPGNARYVEDRAIDAHSYVEALVMSLDETFNDGDFAECISNDILSAEFRPYQAAPTPVIKHIMKDRSVTFLRNGAFDPAKDAPKVDAKSGDMLFVNPIVYTDNALAGQSLKTGVHASMTTRVFDHAMMAGWTEGSLEKAVTGVARDFCQKIIDEAVTILNKAPDLQTAKVNIVGSTPAAIAQSVMDGITMNLPFSVGDGVDDFCIAMSQRMEAILDLAAQRAGHANADEMLGCTICTYSGDDKKVFMVPRGYSMLSFRSDVNGDTVRVMATRNAARACYDIEVECMFEVMAYGMVKVKDNANFDVQRDASYPLVHCIDFS